MKRPFSIIVTLLGTFESTEDGSLIANQETQSVSDLTNTISQLKQVIGEQRREISKLKKRLNGYCEELTSTKKLYQEQLEAKGNLINQGKRVKAVIDMAQLERKSLYEDIESFFKRLARESDQT